jgi:hypothetical protein
MSLEYMVNQGYAGQGLDTPKTCWQPSLQERMDAAVKAAEERLAQVKEARDILARNPDIERLLNIMQKSPF